MSIRSGEWGSSGETEAHLVREGITQQPGPFYNGNFSSSIWGNPPTPPLWRDVPAPNASCSTSGVQPFGLSSSSKHTAEPVCSHKIEILNQKEEKVSRWAGDFPFRQQAGAQESASSPFSYGFPPPSPSPPSSSSSCAHVTSNGSSCLQTHLAGKNIDGNSHKNPVIEKPSLLDKGSSQHCNEEKAFSLKDLSTKWESMLQPQYGPWCSTDSQAPLHGSFMLDSSAVLASSKDIRQPLEHSYGNPFVNADLSFRKERRAQHSYGNPFANADMPSNCLDKQPLGHSYDNPFANADTNAASLHAQQPSFIGFWSASPNLENCKRTPMFSRQKGDSGTFVFGSRPVYNNSANVGLCQQKGFVFGTGAASGVSGNVGFSQQRDSYSSAAGSVPRSSITNTKDKKHNFFVNKKNSNPPARTAFQPEPFKPSSDMARDSNSCFKFTIGANDADRLHCPNLADAGYGPASNLQNFCASAQKDSLSFGVNTTASPTPSIFAGRARASTEETHSMGSSLEEKLFQQRSKNQHAQSIGEKFTTWHPFLQKEEKVVKKCGLNRDVNAVSSSESTSSWSTSDKLHEKWEASGAREGLSHEELPTPSLETNRTFEGSKLAEFDLNSPGKPSVEDLREKAAKWVRSGEEIKRQKENQEPNFVFGSQKASRPFVFTASRTPGSTKQATLSADALNKKEWRSKGSKESKVLEHLLNKLGEKMANLGKCDATQSNHSRHRGETVAEGIREFNASSKSPCKKPAKYSLGAADIFERNIALNCSIEELREQLAKLGRSDNQVNGQNDKAGQVSSPFHGNSIALEHAVKELGEQIAKLANFGEEQEENTADKGTSASSVAPNTGSCDSSALKHAVEELSEQIAKLGRAFRGNNKDDSSSNKGHCNDMNEQSVKDLRKKMAPVGSLAKENNYNSNHDSTSRPNSSKVEGAFLFPACNTGAPEESAKIPFSWSKSSASYGEGDGLINNAYLNPFRDIRQSTLFPSNAFTGAQSSNSFSQVNPFAAGQAPPFTQVHSRDKSSLHEMPASSNGVGEGLSQKGFEFHGIKGPPSGTTMRKKIARACVNMRRCDKQNLTRQKKSPVLQSKGHSSSSAHSTVSPMDVSPCADKHASVSPKSGSDEAQQTPGWKSWGPNFGEDESMSVEELRKATSNLSFGKLDESRMGDDQNSRSFEHSRDQASPFVLHQKKGTWRRACRNKCSTNWTDFKVQFTSAPKTAHPGAHGIDRRVVEEHTQNSSGEGFNLRSYSPLTDTHIQDARVDSVRKSTWDQGSSVFLNGKFENITSMSSSTKSNQSFRSSKPVKEQNDSSKSEESPASPTGTRTATAEQVCENWRLRGNQAYAKGDYEKAEDCYTRGVGSISSDDASQSYRRASMLCFSNRAATRMAVGRMREALEDCKQAMMLDSSFLRVRLRAASCHLALGENNAAATLFLECWNHAKERSSSDMKIVEEALEGIRKSQRSGDLLERASKLCQGETSTDASAALNLLDEALLICPFSEALLELKAHTLFSVRRFEDVLHLCQQTLPAAEENMVVEQHHNQSMAKDTVLLNLWRWRICGKSFFHLGRLEESLSGLTKYEEATCTIPPNRATNMESMAALVSTIRDLLQHKTSGNEAFQAGRHDEAIEHYTAALACNGESRPYNAVCFCNRAAASQALDHIADAIADCSRAIVLDPQYAKAISRRATLHEMLRDYGQTCNDLERLVTLLEGQEARSKSPKSTRAGSKNAQDLRQARDRFEKATKEMKKGSAVDHYRILGLDVSCSSNDVKKAYRKAALKHHPDKAGQFLARGENGDDGNLWKEVGDEARRDAERLFKLIGEANATLSDPEKRAQYDAENYMPRARNPTHTRDGSTDDNWSPGEKNGRRQRDRREWHSARYYRWQNGPDAAQPDTYSERGSRDSSAYKDSKNKGRRSDFHW